MPNRPKRTNKICIVVHSNAFGGGIQHRRAMLVEDWIGKRFDVSVACLKRREIEGKEISFGSNVTFLTDYNGRNAWLPVYSIIPLVKFFRENNFDAVLAGEAFCAFATQLALRISKNPVPFFLSVHNPIGFEQVRCSNYNITDWVKLALDKFLFQCTASRSRAIIAISDGVRKSYEKAFPKVSQKFATIYNPIISKELCEAPSFVKRASGGELRAIAVGRLHWQKGFDMLLEIMLKCFVRFDLFIFGDGPDRAELERLIKERGLQDRVFLMGSTPCIVDEMRKSDIFLLPSRWEGLGNVIVEALFAQLPVVAFNCPGGVSEVLEDGKYGKLVDCYDLDAFAAAIDQNIGGKNINERWRDFSVDAISTKYLTAMGLTSEHQVKVSM